jgi:hypothetical protein
MAAPERFAEKSDLPLQRGHRPYMAHNVISLPSIDALRKISLDHLLGGGQKARQEGPAGQKAVFNLAAGRINSVRR